MKQIKQWITLLLSVVLLLFATACNNGDTSVETVSDLTEGTLNAQIKSVQYDNETGAMNAIVTVTNKTEYAKKITHLEIESIADGNGNLIASDGDFSLENDVYLRPDESCGIECIFENDQLHVSPEQIDRVDQCTAVITLSHEGCVLDGADPTTSETQDFTASVKELKFTASRGIEATIALRNNTGKDMNIGSVSIELMIDNEYDLLKEPLIKESPGSVKAGEVLTFTVAAFPDDVADTVKEQNYAFDTVDDLCTIQ